MPHDPSPDDDDQEPLEDMLLVDIVVHAEGTVTNPPQADEGEDDQ